jgi:arylsulfatase A-like enzyme
VAELRRVLWSPAPEQTETGRIDTGRLVSLADIFPTLLATVPIEPKPGLAGVNLMAGASTDSRYLVLRSARMTRTAHALRTEDWKVVFSGEVNVELYDLKNDPGEQRNLAADKLLFSAGLVNLLHQRIRSAPELTLARSQTDLDDVDRAMLKELGYLE